jgi:hypothetical protein
MPEPILIAIATTLAAKGAQSLYDLVKKKFADRREAKAALEAAEGATPGSPEVQALATQLQQAEAEDPQFATELRQQWNSFSVQQADHGAVNNQISGNVSGKVVQARDIQGGISF